jgi:DNA polymerase
MRTPNTIQRSRSCCNTTFRGYTGGVVVEDFLTYGAATEFSPTPYAQSIYPWRQVGDMLFRFVRPVCPAPVLAAIARGDVFVAHNARFEQAIWYWICHKLWGWPNIVHWSCTAARSRYWGLRASLDGATSDLELPNKKDENGKQFINDFCKPRKYKGAKKLGIVKDLWFEPHENPEGWQKGLVYGARDVLAEMDIDQTLPDLPELEQQIWELDFKINTRGLPIDTSLVERAQQFSDYFTEQNNRTFEKITELRPTQRDRVLEYINQREEIETLGDLRSKTLKRITMTDLSPDLQDVINIRMEASRASIKKLESMARCTDEDGNARGLFLYHGAATGRWTAKRVQPQNYIRGNAKVAKVMFDFLEGPWWNAGMVGHNGGPPLDEMPTQPAWIYEAGLRFPRPLSALAQAMRGFIAAPKGKKIVAGDYAQIEARVLAWIAREMWLLQAFRDKVDVYVKFGAEFMYGQRYDDCFLTNAKGEREVTPAFKPKRQVAKSAVLGCGYSMSWRAFIEYCDNVDIMLTEEESKSTIKAYRNAHPRIADYDSGLWARAERAAIAAVGNEGQAVALAHTGIYFHVHRIDSERFWLICTLPSGRHIAYYRPKVELGQRFGRTVEMLSYRREWAGMTFREYTYGGKIVENFVQGIARDICAVGALGAESAGYPVIGLVHDEVVTLCDEGFGSHEELARIMCQLPAWVTDCPVEAEGGTMYRYGK